MTSFEKLWQQANSDAEKQRLLDLRHRSGIDEDDPSWALSWLLEDSVQRIQGAARSAVQAANVEIQAAGKRTKELLTKSIVSHVDMRVFNDRMQEYSVMVIVGTLGIMLVGFLVLGWVSTGINRQAMEQLAEETATSVGKKVGAELDMVVAAAVAKGLRIGSEHEDEILSLLSVEEKQPGFLAFALQPAIRKLQFVEQNKPGSIEYAASNDGQFAFSMYKRNDRKPCNTERQESGPLGPVRACLNIIP